MQQCAFRHCTLRHVRPQSLKREKGQMVGEQKKEKILCFYPSFGSHSNSELKQVVNTEEPMYISPFPSQCPIHWVGIALLEDGFSSPDIRNLLSLLFMDCAASHLSRVSHIPDVSIISKCQEESDRNTSHFFQTLTKGRKIASSVRC